MMPSRDNRLRDFGCWTFGVSDLARDRYEGYNIRETILFAALMRSGGRDFRTLLD